MKHFVGLTIFLLQMESIFVNADKEKETESFQKCSYDYCLPTEYNKMEAPFIEFEPLEIEIEIDVLQIHEIDDITFTICLSLNLNVIWQDFRIIGTSSDDPTAVIPIDSRFVESLWLPDLYIYNMKEILPKKFNIPFAGTAIFVNLVENVNEFFVKEFLTNLWQASNLN